MLFNTTPEYVRLVQHERERELGDRRLAALAASVRARCNRSVLQRFARTLRLAPATC